MSHPSWVCGLKQTDKEKVKIAVESHPSWVCGLKHLTIDLTLCVSYVTPFVGVWIETLDLLICLVKK